MKAIKYFKYHLSWYEWVIKIEDERVTEKKRISLFEFEFSL